MTLREKLDLFNLSEKERKIAEEKFLVSLALVTDEELKETLKVLKNNDITITKARELKVVVNSSDEINKKISILKELKELNIYINNPNMINHNVIDIYKKIKYCMQVGKQYKKPDGSYEDFIFSESAWQKEFTKEEVKEDYHEEELVTVTPPMPPVEEEKKVTNENVVDIKEYLNSDLNEIEAKKNDFATINQELEAQLAELDSLRDFNPDEEISFNDIEPESYGMGRRAA